MKTSRKHVSKLYSFLILPIFLLSIVFIGESFAVTAIDGFDPNANGAVRAIVFQQDGKIVIGGSFTTVAATARNYLARLNNDGSLDSSFANASADNYVSEVALQADGKVLVGGGFANIGGVARNGIARLNTDGTIDLAFNPVTNDKVYTIAVQSDGKIMIGGAFTSVNGTVRNFIARLNSDGSLDTAFNPGADNGVETIVIQPDGKILVGGFFTTKRLNTDGSIDTSFTQGANTAPVEAIAVQPDGKIIIGGAFTDIGGVGRNHIARLNHDGSLDASFNPNADSDVNPNSIVIQPDGKIIVGGAFVNIVGVARNKIARLNQDGTLDTSFNPNANNEITAVAIQPDGKPIVGGVFTTISGLSRNSIARLNANGTVDATLNPGADNMIYSTIVQPDGKMLVGGWFATLGGQARSKIARLNPDGSLDTAFNPNADSWVDSMAVQPDGKILVGGNFTNIGGQARSYIARLNPDGTADLAFNPNATGTVRPIVVLADGKILVGGSFTTMGGQARNRIARLNSDGSLDIAFNPNANGSVYSIVMQSDGKILVGGSFTSIVGQARNYMARLNTDGTLDAAFNPNADGYVATMAVQADGKILVGGGFLNIAGQARNKIARLNADGTLDLVFNPNADNDLSSITLQADGKMLLNGDFVNIAGQARNKMARLNPDGTLDTTFDAIANNWGFPGIQPDGKILIGGNFTNIGGQARNYIARLNADYAALQKLTVSSDGTATTWARGQSSPEVYDVIFDYSNDMNTWTSLGAGTRFSGGWKIEGLSLPYAATGYVRARGKTFGGRSSASTSLIESIRQFYNPLPSLKADYQFQNNLASSVGLPVPPQLQDISIGGGVNSFVSDVVRGTTTTVLSFPQKNGLLLSPASSVIPGNVYTVAVLFYFNDITGYRRIVDFKDSGSDSGLYNYDGKLVFYKSGIVWSASPTISACTYAQVVITRDASANVVGYVNGVQQISFVDSSDDAVVSANDKIKFFRDNTTGSGLNEESAGKVSRIRIWDYALSAADVLALEPAVTSYTVNITKTGLGGGNITGSGTYNSGDTTTLSATADPNCIFTGWGGDCSGMSNPVLIIVDKNLNCTANFGLSPVSGSCGSSHGQVLSSSPASGLCSIGTASSVSGSGPWTWTCAGQYGGLTASCSANIFVSAQVTYSLTITKTGNGYVTSMPSGINCGDDCKETYNKDQSVTLSAKPDPGFLFNGWTGCDTTSGLYCKVSLGNNKEVKANFEKISAGISAPPTSESLDFGEVKVGRLKNKVYKITNSGKGYVTISANITGDNTKMFAVKLTGKKTIKPGASYGLVIMYKPKSKGPKSGSLVISSNVPDSAPITVNLKGTGK